MRGTADEIQLTEEGRLFMRTVHMAFDAYLERHRNGSLRFSRTA